MTGTVTPAMGASELYWSYADDVEHTDPALYERIWRLHCLEIEHDDENRPYSVLNSEIVAAANELLAWGDERATRRGDRPA